MLKTVIVVFLTVGLFAEESMTPEETAKYIEAVAPVYHESNANDLYENFRLYHAINEIENDCDSVKALTNLRDRIRAHCSETGESVADLRDRVIENEEELLQEILARKSAGDQLIDRINHIHGEETTDAVADQEEEMPLEISLALLHSFSKTLADAVYTTAMFSKKAK